MATRIPAAGETFAIAGWREDAGYLLFHSPPWAKARATQHWIDCSAQVVTPWNKEQAEWLRRIALGGRSSTADECESTVLDALIDAGFVREQAGERVALTDAGLARARELRFASQRQPR